MESTDFEEYVVMCCTREDKVYQPSYSDPLAQVCNECKADRLMKKCIEVMETLDAVRVSQVITALLKRV